MLIKIGLKDILEYPKVRRVLKNPWSFVAARRGIWSAKDAYFDAHLTLGYRIRLRNGSRDFHTFHRIFIRDEYFLDRLNGLNSQGLLGCVIDIGAHIGLFTVRISQIARNILCYEPASDNFELLSHNVKKNGLEGRVSLFKSAVSSLPGMASLYRRKDPYDYSIVGGNGYTKMEEVPTTTLSDIFLSNAIERCDLLKLDCEGAEYDIISQADESLLRKVHKIVLEYHPVAGRSSDIISRKLRRVGFDVKTLPSKKIPSKGIMICNRKSES